jgi:hypothetical protein
MPPLDIAGIPKPAALPVAAPQAQHGNASMALQKVQGALKMLEEALPGVPMGTEMHTNLLKVVSDLAKGLQKVQADPSLQIQQLLQQAKQASQGSPMAALNKMYPPGAPGAGGGAPPPAPPPTPAAMPAAA